MVRCEVVMDRPFRSRYIQVYPGQHCPRSRRAAADQVCASFCHGSPCRTRRSRPVSIRWDPGRG
ncbi:hypothetical protein ACFFX0_03645 [Citricoccus parietis]|uniref:Uncharacterized protein n=1 Tax=Citricoccus parietis TaxID=592307 RepID=A0ABV5FUJ3_9MICC